MANKDSAPVANWSYPAYAKPDAFASITGLGRRKIYEMLGEGQLKAVKCGAATLIDVKHGLSVLSSMPAAKIRAPKSRDKQAA